jgi:hypothetical protein
MRRVRTKKLPENCVVLTPEAFAQLMAVAREAHRDPGELLSIAVRVFAVSVRHLAIMHEPPFTARMQSTSECEAAIAAAHAKCKPPDPETPAKPAATKTTRHHSTAPTPIGVVVRRTVHNQTRRSKR